MTTTNNYSYQQLYTQPQLKQQHEDDDHDDDQYDNQFMLDQNDQIELYQSQRHQQQAHLKIISGNVDARQGCVVVDVLGQVGEGEGCQVQQMKMQEELEVKEVVDFLRINYTHFHQQTLIKMLYESLFPATIEISINPKQQTHQTFTNFSSIKRENIETQVDQQQDINSLVKLHQTAKVFVQHGYGINIARKYALKGQIIEPNPYNNSIGKVIKNAWKDIETEMINMKKLVKQLKTEKYNQIKTPLIHSRNWMQKKYFDIFKQIILYAHGISTEKPSQKSYQELYNYVLQSVFRKSNSSEKGFYKNKSKVQDRGFDESSSQQFKPQKPEKQTNERFEHMTNMVKKSLKKSTKW